MYSYNEKKMKKKSDLTHICIFFHADFNAIY